MSTSLSASRFEAGQQLQHYSGAVWEVTDANLDGDGVTWRDGMVICADDYLITGVGAAGAPSGRTMRVHADYLHGDGWERVRP